MQSWCTEPRTKLQAKTIRRRGPKERLTILESCAYYFNKNTFWSVAVKFSIKDLLPWAKIKLAFCYGYYNLSSHYLPFKMSIGIIFSRIVVLVLRCWFVWCNTF